VNISLAYDMGYVRSTYSDFEHTPDHAVAPELNFYDTTKKRWMNVRDTCKPPFELVDYTAQMYTVSICHLTQVRRQSLRPSARGWLFQAAAGWINRLCVAFAPLSFCSPPLPCSLVCTTRRPQLS